MPAGPGGLFAGPAGAEGPGGAGAAAPLAGFGGLPGLAKAALVAAAVAGGAAIAGPSVLGGSGTTPVAPLSTSLEQPGTTVPGSSGVPSILKVPGGQDNGPGPTIQQLIPPESIQPVTSVPEPATVLTMGAGLFATLLLRRRRR